MSLDQSGNSLVRTRNENQNPRRMKKEYIKKLLSHLNLFQKKSEVYLVSNKTSFSRQNTESQYFSNIKTKKKSPVLGHKALTATSPLNSSAIPKTHMDIPYLEIV